MIVVLAGNERQAKLWCEDQKVDTKDVMIVRSVTTLEGLRFTFNDVVFVGSWNTREDINEIMDRIKISNVTASPRSVNV